MPPAKSGAASAFYWAGAPSCAPRPPAHAPERRSRHPYGRSMTARLSLGFDLGFTDLYEREGLAQLDGHFLGYLGGRDGALKGRLEAARAAPADVAGEPESE